MPTRNTTAKYVGAECCIAWLASQGVLEQLRQDPVLRKVLDSPKMQRALNEVCVVCVYGAAQCLFSLLFC